MRIIMNGYVSVDIFFCVYSGLEANILCGPILLLVHTITDPEPPAIVCVSFVTAEPSSGTNNDAGCLCNSLLLSTYPAPDTEDGHRNKQSKNPGHDQHGTSFFFIHDTANNRYDEYRCQDKSAQNSKYRFQHLFHSKPGGLEARSADRPKPYCADFFRREDRMWRENPATRLKVASRNAFPAVPEGLSVFLILSGKTAFSAAINHCCFCTLSNQRTGKNAQKNPAYAICSRFLGAEIRIGV